MSATLRRSTSPMPLSQSTGCWCASRRNLSPPERFSPARHHATKRPGEGMTFRFDRLLFSPRDVDLARSPLAGKLDAETYTLGAFNPGLTRLPNGNLLLMVRVAEALRTPIADGHINAIRWYDGGYTLDAWPLDFVDTSDPRKFMMRGGGWKVMALTSLSWLLPVELSADGRGVVAVH